LLPSRRKSKLRVIVPVGSSMLLSLAGDLTLYTVLPISFTNLGLTLAMTGILLSANRLVRLGSNPIAGILVDRWGRRKPILLGLGLGTLSSLFYILPGGFPVFLFGRLLWGVSWSLLFIGAYSMILDVTTNEDRGWGSGILVAFYFTAVTINPLIGGLLHDLIGFSGTIGVCVLLGGLGLLIALFTLPETLPVEARSIRRTGQPTNRHFKEALAELKGKLIPHNTLLIKANYLYALTIFIGDGLIMSTVTLYLKQQYGDVLMTSGTIIQIASLGGVLLALRSVISAVIAPVAGIWSDSRGARWLVIGWATFIGVAGLILLSLASNPWIMILAVALLSIQGGVVITLIPAIAGDASTHEKGATIGMLTTSGDIGSSIAPIASYSLLAWIPLGQIYLLSAFLLATGLPLVWREVRKLSAKDVSIVPGVD
jgi:MFS family permease